MTQSWNADPYEMEDPDDPESCMVSVDSRELSEDLIQEIVVLAGTSWLVWVSTKGEVVAAQRGAYA